MQSNIIISCAFIFVFILMLLFIFIISLSLFLGSFILFRCRWLWFLLHLSFSSLYRCLFFFHFLPTTCTSSSLLNWLGWLNCLWWLYWWLHRWWYFSFLSWSCCLSWWLLWGRLLLNNWWRLDWLLFNLFRWWLRYR